MADRIIYQSMACMANISPLAFFSFSFFEIRVTNRSSKMTQWPWVFQTYKTKC